VCAGSFQIRNFINGEFVQPATGNYLDNIEPATGKSHTALLTDVNGADADDFGIKCSGWKNAITERKESDTGPTGTKRYCERAIGIATAHGRIIAILYAPDGSRAVGINVTSIGYSREHDHALDGADKLSKGAAVTPDLNVYGKVAEAGVGKRMGCVDKFSDRSALDQANDTFSGGTSRSDKERGQKDRSENENVFRMCFH
jgi:hypothetical protein